MITVENDLKISGFSSMVVSTNGWFTMEHDIKMNDNVWGTPMTQETTKIIQNIDWDVP